MLLFVTFISAYGITNGKFTLKDAHPSAVSKLSITNLTGTKTLVLSLLFFLSR